MEENMKTVLSNQVFENKKRKQHKKELFLINVIIGIIVVVLVIVALIISLLSEPGIKAYPFVVIAGVFVIIDAIIMWVTSDAKSTFGEVKDVTEEEIRELAEKYLASNQKNLGELPIEFEKEIKRLENDLEKKKNHKQKTLDSIKSNIKELNEILGIKETN